MSPDQLYDKMLGESKDEIATLNVGQTRLYGYAAGMRQFPAYLSFCQRYPTFGNAELANDIASRLQDLTLTGMSPSELDRMVVTFDDRFVPNMEDFGAESAALEGALALIFLYKYSVTNEPKFILEIVRGIVECILMSDDTSRVLQDLLVEETIRRGQFDLIESSVEVSARLMEQCLALNDGSSRPK